MSFSTENNSELGKEGENIASRYLQSKGYEILHRNWHFKSKEIDIIARQNNEIVIVEVKTRTNDCFEQPEDAVNIRKQRFLIAAANEYVTLNNYDCDVRFDIIGITITHNQPIINHIEDAFYPLSR